MKLYVIFDSLESKIQVPIESQPESYILNSQIQIGEQEFGLDLSRD